MKFKIKHETRAFLYGIIIPWGVAAVTLLLFVFFGFTVFDELPARIFLGTLILCGAVEIISILLYTAEKIFGAKIIIESDHIKVRMFLRCRNIRFDDIADAKYRHYYDRTEEKNNPYSILTQRADANFPTAPIIRSQIIFYLLSGKVFKLNDVATNYKWKRNLWITNPEVDPDGDVKLYQAYLCYRSAWHKYYNTGENALKYDIN